MRQKIVFGIFGTALWLGNACLLSAAHDYKLEDRSPVSHTFSGNKTIDVDLIGGTMTIVGDGGNTMRVTGERVIRADSQDQIARAKKDDVLDMNEKDGVAQLYENGPFRNNNGGHSSDDHGFHDTSEHHYDVEWNLTIHIPRDSALHLRTVNGSINAQDTSGAFDVRTVNGTMTMTNIAGSGSIAAVNGTNTVSFRENPKSDSSFTSVNGKIDVTFQPNLSADFNLKTVNGGMFTDFESTALASSGGVATKDNFKYVYRMRGESRIRIGAAGGPQIKMETVNGGIQIRKK